MIAAYLEDKSELKDIYSRIDKIIHDKTGIENYFSDVANLALDLKDFGISIRQNYLDENLNKVLKNKIKNLGKIGKTKSESAIQNFREDTFGLAQELALIGNKNPKLLLEDKVSSMAEYVSEHIINAALLNAEVRRRLASFLARRTKEASLLKSFLAELEIHAELWAAAELIKVKYPEIYNQLIEKLEEDTLKLSKKYIACFKRSSVS